MSSIIICSSLGIARHICTAYHPQSNGLRERFNQTICACLSKYSEGGKLNWEDDLDLFCLVIAHPYNYPPFELMYGMKARLPIELDLPPHKCQDDKDDNCMEKLMVNSKLLGEKRSDAWEHSTGHPIKAVRQKTLQARRFCSRRRSLVCQFQTKYKKG